MEIHDVINLITQKKIFQILPEFPELPTTNNLFSFIWIIQRLLIQAIPAQRESGGKKESRKFFFLNFDAMDQLGISSSNAVKRYVNGL